MESYDIFLLLILVAGVVFGALKGIAWQIASLSAIFVSYIVALNFHELVAGLIEAEEPWNRYIAMFALYMGTSLCIWIAFAMVRRVIEKVELKDFDRHAGAILGAVNGAIVCVLITLFAVTLPILGDDQKSSICRSKSGYLIAQAINHMEVGLPQDVSKVVAPYLDDLKEQLDEHHPEDESDTLFASDEESSEDQGGGEGDAIFGQPRYWWQPEEDRSASNLLDDIDRHFGTDQR